RPTPARTRRRTPRPPVRWRPRATPWTSPNTTTDRTRRPGATLTSMGTPTRWETDTGDNHSDWYVERFRTMAAEGADLEGEARLIDAMVPPGSRILDAGCGPGRTAAALHRRGHIVVGVDADPVLIAAAEEDHPGPRWVVADLA